MKEKQEEIIKKIDGLEDVKRIKVLKKKIHNNSEYIKLIREFEDNKNKYIENSILNDKIVELRKKLFEIDELKEYLEIQTNIRLLSVQINNIIKSIISDKNCS